MLEWLKTFIVVFQTLNFSVAATELSVSQPTVSLHIKNLEDHLNTLLFSRNGKQEMRPTQAGEYLYPRVVKILNNLDESFMEVSGQNQLHENVTIGASHNTAKFLLTKVVSELITKFPQFNFTFREMNSHEVMEKLAHNQLTIGLVEMPIAVANVKKDEVYTDRLLIAGNPEAKYWILREKDSGMRFFNDIYLSETDANLEIIETNSDEITKELIVNGTGRAVISSLAREDFGKNVPISDYKNERKMYLAQNTSEKSPEISEIYQWLRFQISGLQRPKK